MNIPAASACAALAVASAPAGWGADELPPRTGRDPAPDREGEEPAMVRREALTAHGMKLSYLRAPGRADGPRLLLVHGSPNEAVYWKRYLEEPVAGLETVAVDRPGFG
ncbi:MAG TPA: hypothetical protein VIL46_02345, partial [Gemmataceae bacterium]